jgi:phosphonate degradation associated HDIG domain protein
MNTQQVIDDVFERFRENGRRQYGESVTETQHALQCATFAQRADEAPVVVAACLLHDYGHLCHDLGEDIAHKGTDAHHEDLGAARLRVMFVEEVVEPVRLHVTAKRYLCWKERSYLGGLSEASRRSLELQGGPMDEVEAAEFERNPHYDAAVRVRRYDDMGKMPEMATLDFEAFRAVLEPFVRQTN